jgi:hypothetical protein
MPQLLTHIEEILLSQKRDIFFLQIHRLENEVLAGDRPDESKVTEVLQWLDSRGVAVRKIAAFADPEIIFEGWPGWYHVDFQGWDDPALVEYSSVYEDADGKPLNPDRFQIWAISYADWVKQGGPERYEKYLSIVRDPDYCP